MYGLSCRLSCYRYLDRERSNYSNLQDSQIAVSFTNDSSSSNLLAKIETEVSESDCKEDQNSYADSSSSQSEYHSDPFDFDSGVDQHLNGDTNSSKSESKFETSDESWISKILIKDRNSSKSELEPFECHKCFSTFKLKWNLDRHLLTHTNRGKPIGTFQCTKCSLTFNRKWNLDRHIASHKKRDRVNILYPKLTQHKHTDEAEEPEGLPWIPKWVKEILI